MEAKALESLNIFQISVQVLLDDKAGIRVPADVPCVALAWSWGGRDVGAFF